MKIEEEISKYVMEDQIAAANKIVEILNDDGITEDLRAIDLIDAFATAGVMLVRGDHSAFAYQYMLTR